MAIPRPTRLVLLACLPALSLFAALPAHAQKPPAAADAPLQERMSYAEFTRLGLDKLSPAQLKALNAWLHTHGDRGPSVDAAPAAPAPRAQTRETGNKDIHSRIVGRFHGWDSDTVFTLANGQKWQVSDDSQLMMHSIDNPKVTLKKGFFGSWILSVDGSRDSVRVTQVR